MKKKILILIILLLPLISGCNYKELNNLSIINYIAIDYIDNEYLTTVKVLNTEKNTDNQSDTFNGVTYSAKGKTITESITNISLSIPKKIYLSHIELLVISESVANNKLNDIIDYFIKNNEVNKNFSVLLSRNSSAKEILEEKELLSSYPYGNILSSIENSSNTSGISSDIKFIDLAYYLNTNYKTPILTTIKLDNDKLTIDNLAIFKNNKIISYLDNQYNLGYNFMTDNINQAIINYKCDNDKYSSVRLNNTNTIIRPKIKNNKPYINIYITGDIYLIENTCNNTNTEIRNNTSKEINNIISNVLEYSKDNINTDIFNIEEIFYKFKNKYYNSINFKDKYKDMKYKIITRLEMR